MSTFPKIDYFTRLPDELILKIVNDYSCYDNVAFPPLSKLFLPFHRIDLYRLIHITDYRALARFVDHLDKETSVRPLVRHFAFTITVNDSLDEQDPPTSCPSTEDLVKLFKYLPNLAELLLVGCSIVVNVFLRDGLANRDNLKLLSLHSTFAGIKDPFDIDLLRPYSSLHTLSVQAFATKEEQPNCPETTVIPAFPFLVKLLLCGYLAVHSDSTSRLVHSCQPKEVTLIDFSQGSAVNSVLAQFPNPAKIHSLTINALTPVEIDTTWRSFTSLQQLDIRRGCKATEDESYEILLQLPLKHFEIGPESLVDAERLASVLKRHLTLKAVVLHHIQYDETSDTVDWPPSWNVRNFANLLSTATDTGIMVSGSAVLALKEYRAGEDSSTDDSDESGDSDGSDSEA